MRLLRALWMQIRGSEDVAHARPKRDGDRAKRGWVAETVTAQASSRAEQPPVYGCGCTHARRRLKSQHCACRGAEA